MELNRLTELLNYVFQAKLAVHTILKITKTHKNGMRYKAEQLLECLLLRIKSKATYEHLRRRKFMPLSHRTTLARLLSGMSCHFGFDKFALDEIEKALEGKREEDRLVVLSFNEVSIKTSFQNMNVNVAMQVRWKASYYSFMPCNYIFQDQVLTHFVAKAFEFFCSARNVDGNTKKLFKDSLSTENLFFLLNNSFDIMNARCPREGIKKHSLQEKKKYVL